jgi:octaprenyl-diphosphate synthase
MTTHSSTAVDPRAEPAADPLARAVALVADDLEVMNQEIIDRLRSEVVLINQMGQYIVGAGGKRLRPLVLLLAARHFQCDPGAAIRLAAVIEFIHTATLLHDDVVDESALRRGRETANEVWGNAASVLVGDFLYSRSFQMMVEAGSMRVMEILADTTNTIAEGEVMQLLNCHSPDVTEAQYLRTIQCKTARLFESATRIPAVLADAPAPLENDLAAYGLHLGTAFQLVDDMLDYSGASEAVGKNLGDDLAEGKPTLPVIHALTQGTPAERKRLREVIRTGDRHAIAEVVAIIETTGSLTYTSTRARDHASRAQQALASLPESPYRRALFDLADFAVERTY